MNKTTKLTAQEELDLKRIVSVSFVHFYTLIIAIFVGMIALSLIAFPSEPILFLYFCPFSV